MKKENELPTSIEIMVPTIFNKIILATMATIIVIIPAFNEENGVGQVLQEISKELGVNRGIAALQWPIR